LSNTESERGVKRGILAIGTSGVLLISLMKKLRVTLKRTGNVVEFLKTMREGRFQPMSGGRQRCLVVWRL
jgi:hypothetical protein